jgi:hypothetical protein
MDKVTELSWAIMGVCKVMDGFDQAGDIARNNEFNSKLGIPDYNESWRTYYSYLDKLYDIAVENHILDKVLEYLADEEDDTTEFASIVEERQDEQKEAEHQAMIDSLDVGDKVRLYDGRVLYVCDNDEFEYRHGCWVTESRANRTNPDARGWYADYADIVEIVEKYRGED